ncbi:sugar nucleotide-binding protein, partial [Acidithiobacillus ferrooxidans]
MHRVLLLGAQGQVGWELQRSRPASVELRALGRPDLDILDAAQVRGMAESFRPDAIINAAAYTAVDRAESESARAYAVNRDGAAHCALAAQACGARLIHLSTDFVFDGAQATPYPPEAPLAPLGVYGASKADGERQVQAILG